MYRFEIAGVKIECDDASELKQVVGLGNGHTPKPRSPRVALMSPRKKTHGTAKSWKAAKKLAREKGISVVEARSQIAAAKQKAK